ncbi:MAG: serine hydrolase [Bacteroidales bacterium]|nr:serine hydrolase [Bacteroidales bacterium]MCF8387918.1 serine hydrolase [Bacteroidales bacterium]MCF8396974.1 serine hydrolase [Bacteroidales bacterium]
MLRNDIGKRLFLIVLILLLAFPHPLPAQNFHRDSLYRAGRDLWVDSVFNTLNLEEQIAQLITVRANQPGKKYLKEIDRLIEKYNIGGITFFRSTPHEQFMQTNRWQKKARIPLLVSIDAEWGLGMRLDSVVKFPLQMTLGAIQNDSLIYQMASRIARQCKMMGVHMNFAPVVDVNVNPNNPVINMRSFGEDPENVARKGTAYMEGLQEHGIIATAKHFPGHGDTETDSHLTLPLVNHDWERINKVELVPFRKLINNGVDAVMIAHLYFPLFESTENTATTLSYNTVTKLLKDSLEFNGLVVTDALDMKGVTKYFPPGEIEVKALQAGNDILLLPQNAEKAIMSIKEAILKGNIPVKNVYQSCKKVLSFKYDVLYHPDTTQGKNLAQGLNGNYDQWLNMQLYANAITLVKNNRDLLPVVRPDTLKAVSISIGDKEKNTFQERLDYYGNFDHYQLSKYFTERDKKDLFKKLGNYNLVIISLNNTNILASDHFGITQRSINLIQEIASRKTSVLDLFASPYALSYFDSTKNIDAILISYQDNATCQDISAQVLMGGIAARGRLPVSASSDFLLNTGISTKQIRLEYTRPQEFKIADSSLRKIDSIAIAGINKKAYPGCQIMAVKNGKVFYNKSFGYHTYDEKKSVGPDDLYDLASITKIAATTLSVMKLYQEGKIDIDAPLKRYLSYLQGTDKGNLVIRELMAHQSGLQTWIPYFLFTLDEKGQPDPKIYSTEISEEYPIRVAENFYIRDDYKYILFDSIKYSLPRENHDYKYSDLGFYLLSSMVENVTNRSFDDYVQDQFYLPLGLSTMGFKPLRKFDRENIVPTEEDRYFRNQLLHGDVHDPGAAMLGGVAGHAGLFSNANDLAIMMQMLLHGGHYGGQIYIEPEIIEEFTTCQFPAYLNRRGIGFDKPLLIYEEDGPNCKSASSASFGHSGFTGTYVWADPRNELIYIFLSNRIHPDASNATIMEENIRTNIHQAIYDALQLEDSDIE